MEPLRHETTRAKSNWTCMSKKLNDEAVEALIPDPITIITFSI